MLVWQNFRKVYMKSSFYQMTAPFIWNIEQWIYEHGFRVGILALPE